MSHSSPLTNQTSTIVYNMNAISQFSTELSALVHCLRQFNRGDDAYVLQDLLKKDMDWNSFFRLLRRHRVTVQTHKVLQQLPRGHVDSQILSRLKCQSALVVQRNMGMTAYLISLTRQLTDTGIAYLAFKGPVAGYDLYGTPGIRQMRDLDILIDPEALTQAEAVLLKNGFTRIVPDFSLPPRQLSYFIKNGHHFVYAHPVKKCVIELHWRLFGNSVLFPISFSMLWQQKRSIRMGTQDIFTLGREHTFLMLSVHGSKHSWNRLFWLNDIARMMHAGAITDWPGFTSQVKKMGIERMVAESVILAHCILGTPLPEPVACLAAEDPVIPKMVERSLFLISFPEEGIRPFNRAYRYLKWHQTFLVRNINYHLWHAGVNAGPTLTNMKMISLPDPLFPLYYVIRPLIWFNRYFIRRR